MAEINENWYSVIVSLLGQNDRTSKQGSLKIRFVQWVNWKYYLFVLLLFQYLD